MPTLQANCAHCGIEFPTRRSRGRYVECCSRKCGYARKRRTRELRPDAIQLSDGSWSLVSPEDVEYLRDFGWVQTPSGYARRGAARHTSMHRAVVERMLGRELLRGEVVDHINGSPLDNRRVNLRVGSNQQNMWNHRRHRGSTSDFVGVCTWVGGKARRWRAYIMIDALHIHIGLFDSETEAAWMRDQWTLALFGEHGYLNFEYLPVEAQL